VLPTLRAPVLLMLRVLMPLQVPVPVMAVLPAPARRAPQWL
jgi:hypothetical protein